ncbi:hypothetical protein [uncultured Jatrophihabitans sp.]|uniref:hypothetical protein n=1 Tax=uncultured Jatrophihabitans sp. TaxID=1610747 RepID=UPI0035C9C726
MVKHNKPQRIHGNARVLLAAACVLAAVATAALVWRPWAGGSPQVAPRGHKSTGPAQVTPASATQPPVGAPSGLVSPLRTAAPHATSPAAANGSVGSAGAAGASGAPAPNAAARPNAQSHSTRSARHGTTSRAPAQTHSRTPVPATSSRGPLPIGTPSISLPIHR